MSGPVSESADRHRRASDLFIELVQCDADARAARVAALAAADAPLAQEIAAMLAADDRVCGTDVDLKRAIASALLPFTADIETDAVDPRLGTHVGRYRIDRLIAAGGMGRVYEARQESPARTVAIKLLDTRIVSRGALARFRHEAEIMARLVHPGIAQIYDAGTRLEMEGTSPWFAMELVPNATTIVEIARERRLDVRSRIELFLQVCDAVHFGHGRGVIHRDLKPGNVLVDRSASSLQPKIIDFGIARSTDSDIALATQRTEVGQIVGTLQYMSPEQLGGDPAAIDVRTDVYALGLLLFELLTETMAFDVARLPVHEAIRVIASTEQRRMRDVAPTLKTILSGDLQTIVSKATEREAARRYGSVTALAQDLRRYLDHEPISARPPSAVYMLRLFTRRHRAIVCGAAVSVAMLVLGLIGTGIGLVRAQQSEAASEFDAYVANVMAAEAAMRTHDVKLARQRLDAAPVKHRGWEWRHLNARMDRSIARTTADLVQADVVKFSPSGGEFMVGDRRGVVRAFDAVTLRELWHHRGPHEAVDIGFASDGSRIAVAFDSTEVHILDPATGSLVLRRAFDGPRRLQFDAGNDSILVAGDGGSLARWHLGNDVTETLRKISQFHPDGGVMRLRAVSPDAEWLVVELRGDLRLVRVADGAVVSRFGVEGLNPSVSAFSADGRWLAIHLPYRRLVIRDMTTGAERSAYLDGRAITSLAWCPTEHAVILAEGRGVLTVYDASTLQPLRRILAHGLPVGCVTTTTAGPNEPRIVSVDWSGEVRLWSAETPDVYRHQTNRAWVYGVAFAPDGAWFVTSSGEVPAGDPMVSAFDTRSGRRRWASPASVQPMIVSNVAVSEDGTLVAHNAEAVHFVNVRDALSGTVTSTLGSEDNQRFWAGVRLRPCHREILVNVLNGRALYSVDDGRLLARFELKDVNEQALSPDGELLVLSPMHETGMEIYRIDGASRVAAIQTPAAVRSMAFSPDGRHLAARCANGTLSLWSTSDWSIERTWDADDAGGNAIVFEPDGRLIGRVLGGIRIWDVTRGREILTLSTTTSEPCSNLAVSPNGEWLGAGCSDGSVLLFDAPRATAPQIPLQ